MLHWAPTPVRSRDCKARAQQRAVQRRQSPGPVRRPREAWLDQPPSVLVGGLQNRRDAGEHHVN